MPAEMQVILTTRRVFALRNVIQASIRCKLTKAEIIKRLNKENKTLFGNLVETKKQKQARENREKVIARVSKQSAVDLSVSDSGVNTENYHINHSKSRHLSRVKFRTEHIPNSTKQFLIISPADKPGTEIEKTESVPPVKNAKPEITRANDSEPESANGSKILFRPSPILLKKMTSFSYLDRRKDGLENLNSGKIVSISPYSDKSKLLIPSITKILNKTMSPQSKLNLELWKQRMILQLGQEGFEKYSQELLLNGKQFHFIIQNYLIQKPFDVPSTVEKSWQSVQHVLKEVENTQLIESHVVHSELYYRGIVDCMAMYRGNLCVIDWKKSDKPKNSIEDTYDAPIQVAAYIGALNYDTNYKFQVQRGLVVVAYTNGDPASVHEINPMLLYNYWKRWLRRLQQYYLEQETTELTPISTSET